MTDYFFAYGSLMHTREMTRTCGTAPSIAPARLDDHRLMFTRLSPRWGGGVADVVPAPGMCVWGVLYTIDNTCQLALDLREGNGVAYIRTRVTVHKAGKAPIEATTYVVIQPTAQEIRPVEAYLYAMTQGAAEANLPDDYQDFLTGVWLERTQPNFRGGLLVLPADATANTNARSLTVHPGDADGMPPGTTVTVSYNRGNAPAVLLPSPSQPAGTCTPGADIRSALGLPAQPCYGATVRLSR